MSSEKSIWSGIKSVCAAIWRSVTDAFYAKPDMRAIGWGLIGLVYIGFLMIFTHIDLIIALINNTDDSFFDLVVRKHANFVSLLTNIGLLLFLVIDIMIACDKRVSMATATIVNMVGVLAAVAVMLFSVGCLDPKRKDMGAIEWDMGVIIAWSVFFIALIVLKTKSLLDNKVVN